MVSQLLLSKTSRQVVGVFAVQTLHLCLQDLLPTSAYRDIPRIPKPCHLRQSIDKSLSTNDLQPTCHKFKVSPQQCKLSVHHRSNADPPGCRRNSFFFPFRISNWDSKTIPNTPWSARLLYWDPDQLNELNSHLTNAIQQAPVAIPLFTFHRPMPAVLSGLSLLQDSTLNL